MEYIAPIDADEQHQELLELEAEQCRRSFRFFVERAWPIVEPERRLVHNWHIDEICALLEQIDAGRYTEAIINVPPGTMKSLIVVVFWPAWRWTRRPSLRFMNASYNALFSVDNNSKLRKLVQSDWYRASFGLELTGDQNAKVLFMNDRGGFSYATSIGGGGTGVHPDVVLIDDPHTAQEALSEADRTFAVSWFDATITTRGVTRNVVIIIIMQRLHMKDLSGHLLEKWRGSKSFVHVMFPMRFERARADLRDHRSVEGELLWPELIPEEKVRKLEIGLQELAPGQLQQRPVPKGGALVKRSWIKVIKEAPSGGLACRGWDTAATEGGGDWTAGVKIKRMSDGRYIVVDVKRFQLGPAGVDREMKSTAIIDGRFCRQREEKEPGSSGKTVVLARKAMLNGYDYAGVQIDQDKETRSRPFRAECEAGNVYVVDAHWTEAYLKEICEFPYGDNDDQMDGTSCAYNDLVSGPTPIRSVNVEVG